MVHALSSLLTQVSGLSQLDIRSVALMIRLWPRLEERDHWSVQMLALQHLGCVAFPVLHQFQLVLVSGPPDQTSPIAT